jgi:hypothetical protein
LKFFKFYNVHKYNKKRGFLKEFANNYLKNSNFAIVAMSYGFNYYKKFFYDNLIKINNSNNNFRINKKKKSNIKK